MSVCLYLVGFSQGSYAASLSNWHKNGLSGKTICFVGDSTTSNASALFKELNGFYRKEGEALFGVGAILNYGENGSSLRAYLSDSVVHGITSTIARQADLYIISYGINDIRLGNTSEDQLVQLLRQAVVRIREGVPHADIVLRMPNSFLSSDLGGRGFVHPNSNAPSYSTMLRNAYKRLEGQWENVVVLDTQDEVFGRASPAISDLMGDQIHPSAVGYSALAKALVDLIGVKQPYDAALAAYAMATDPVEPFVVYPLIVEDTELYDLVATGRWVTSSTMGAPNGYLDFTWPGNKSADIRCGDLLQMARNFVNALPSKCLVSSIGANTRIYNLGASLPAITMTGGTVNVWRRKHKLVAMGNWLRSSIAGAPNGYVDFDWPGDRSSEIKCGDLLQMGEAVFHLPPKCRVIPLDRSTRIYNLGGTLPPLTVTGGNVSVWRLR